MKIAVIAAALLVAASGALFTPSQAQAQVNFNLVIGNAPPPPRHEVIPRPRAGHIWVPGYWNWDGRGHDWRGGHWERAREGQVYRRPQWVEADNGWRLQEGGWRRAQGERYQRREREERHERHNRDDYRRDDHGKHRDRGIHCPPGQAKKGNC